MNNNIYASERQLRILDLLSRQGRLSVPEIVAQFSISEATARRDLQALAKDGKIQRFYGGAIPLRKAAPEEPILHRTHDQEPEKERIGQAAAAQVSNGEAVFLGSGTTVLQVAKHLTGKQLTVITNSLPIINLFAHNPEIDLVALGGQFRPSERSFIGHLTDASLGELRADKVIIGIRAISLEHGLTNDYLLETMTDRSILQMGQKVIIVADHTKFGQVSAVHVAPLEKIHTIVTDRLISTEFAEVLQARGIQLIVA